MKISDLLGFFFLVTIIISAFHLPPVYILGTAFVVLSTSGHVGRHILANMPQAVLNLGTHISSSSPFVYLHIGEQYKGALKSQTLTDQLSVYAVYVKACHPEHLRLQMVVKISDIPVSEEIQLSFPLHFTLLHFLGNEFNVQHNTILRTYT